MTLSDIIILDCLDMQFLGWRELNIFIFSYGLYGEHSLIYMNDMLYALKHATAYSMEKTLEASINL